MHLLHILCNLAQDYYRYILLKTVISDISFVIIFNENFVKCEAILDILLLLRSETICV